MRLILAIMRRAAGLSLLRVMSACGEEPRSPPTAPTVPNVPSTPVAPTFTLSGVITERFSGRPVQRESRGVAVPVREGKQLASWRAADDAVRRRRTVHRLRAPVSRARLGKHGANLGTLSAPRTCTSA